MIVHNAWENIIMGINCLVHSGSFRILSLALMGVLTCLPVWAQSAPIQTGQGHRFAAADYTAGKVFVVAADGKVEWEYDSGTCDEIWVLSNGHLLFNTGHGVREVTRDKQTVFSYESKSEVYACPTAIR